MKHFLLFLGIFLSTLNIKAQDSDSICADASVKIILDDFAINHNNDTTYKVLVNLFLFENSNISSISYQVLDSVSSQIINENAYSFSTLPNNMDMLNAGSCTRNGYNIQLSLGYFEIFKRNYKSIFVFNTFDSTNNKIGSTLFYF